MALVMLDLCRKPSKYLKISQYLFLPSLHCIYQLHVLKMQLRILVSMVCSKRT